MLATACSPKPVISHIHPGGKIWTRISLISTALILGATAALQKTAGQVVEDAYNGFKLLLISRFQATKAAVNALEENPADEDTRHFVETKVSSTQAAGAPEVLQQAKALLKLIKAQAPQVTRIAGVKFDEFDFEDALSIDTVKSAEDGVVITRGKAKGKVEIKNIEAGLSRDTDPNA